LIRGELRRRGANLKYPIGVLLPWWVLRSTPPRLGPFVDDQASSGPMYPTRRPCVTIDKGGLLAAARAQAACLK
jgi:hypothetical protein